MLTRAKKIRSKSSFKLGLEILAIFIFASVCTQVCVLFDTYEQFFAFTRQFEEYEIDDYLFFMPGFLMLGFLGLSIKKIKENKSEITRRKQTEAALEQAKAGAEKANEAKSEFLANMSHELRTPLNHIIGFTEMVADRKCGDLNADQAEYLNDVLYSSRHLLSLIDDILDLSKVEAGKLELKPAAVNLNQLLERSLIMIKQKAFNRGIDMSTIIDGCQVDIAVDERKVKQVLYNLLSNAVKFTPVGGHIRLAASRVRNRRSSGADASQPASKDFIEIEVSDSGIGIGAEDLERIFDPFEQAKGSANRQHLGTGLGLSLSKRLVELHGGRIWAESPGEGHGATFRFTLPV